jgi:acyl-CoA thioester hydrolase
MENAPSMKMPVQLRWSDFDANYHLRHSAYYDFGAMVRIEMFKAVGLTDKVFKQEGFGPILFKEECVFRKEVGMYDSIFITCELLHCKRNGARFTIKHRLLKDDDSLVAEITILGDWIDYNTRKLWHPLPFMTAFVEQMPKHPDFTYL